MTAGTVYATDAQFGASPSAPAATNAAAINAAVAYAKGNGLAAMEIGAGVFPIDSTIICSGANQGISIVGVRDGALSQGSAPGTCVLKWVGAAAPMFDVQTTFHTFTGFSLWNVGNGSAVATHGFKVEHCGRQFFDRICFSGANGGSAFTTASIELQNGVNYDRISRCEFETGCALLVSPGSGARLDWINNMTDSNIGSGAFIDIRGGLDVFNVQNGTCNYNAQMPTFIDMSNIGSYRVSVLRVEGYEFDGNNVAAQLTIAKVKNCDSFIFEANQVSSFGDPANTECPIALTDSRATIRNNRLSSMAKPLVRTLDSTSYAYVYESPEDILNSGGTLDPSSQSGNLINAIVSGSAVLLQLHRASPMAHSVYLAELPTSGIGYTTYLSMLGDSSNQSFPTKGQVFTILFHNGSGGLIPSLAFSSQFVLCGSAPPAPAPGKHAQATFVWTGDVAFELLPRGDAA